MGESPRGQESARPNGGFSPRLPGNQVSLVDTMVVVFPMEGGDKVLGGPGEFDTPRSQAPIDGGGA